MQTTHPDLHVQLCYNKNKQIKWVNWCFLPPVTYLSCGFDPLPDAEVAHDPGYEQAQGQVPVEGAHVVDAGGNPQRSPPAETGQETQGRCLAVLYRESSKLKSVWRTHSQNSMTGEVVFRSMDWFNEVFLLWNSTQCSGRRNKQGSGGCRIHALEIHRRWR